MTAAFVLRKYGTQDNAHFLGSKTATDKFGEVIKGELWRQTGEKAAVVVGDDLSEWAVRLFRASCSENGDQMEYVRNGKRLDLTLQDSAFETGSNLWQFSSLGGTTEDCKECRNFLGDIAEIIVFDRWLSNEHAVALETYMLDRYNIEREADYFERAMTAAALEISSNTPVSSSTPSMSSSSSTSSLVKGQAAPTENVNVEESSDSGPIIGAVIGAVLCLAGTALVGFALVTRNRKKNKVNIVSDTDTDHNMVKVDEPHNYGRTSFAIK